MKKEPNIHIVIPAKDEVTRIEPVLAQLKELGFDQIIVVDDGSNDETGDLARKMGCTVLRHPVNLGAGAATLTGIEYALSQQADLIVTMDADGQHDPKDVIHLVKAATDSEVDVVVGIRFVDGKGKAPRSRAFYNRIANLITWMLTGKYCQDSQSGMKCIKAPFAKKLKFRFSQFEFCTEMFHFVSKENARFTEVPIRTIYSTDSMSKGQNIWIGIRMVYRMLIAKM